MKKINVGFLFILSFISSSAEAVDLTKVLVNDEGKPMCMISIKDTEECPIDKVAILGKVVKTALYTMFPDEQNLSGEDKYKRAELAQSMTGAVEIKPKAEDIALMKKLVAKLYGPIIVYQAWQELDPPQKEK